MPLVSVVMVCHRDTSYVRPAVNSVFEQTLTDLELVFVSNGSGLTPGDLGTLGADPRLRWVELAENFGIAVGLNAGIEVAAGDFVAVLDSDDIARPTRLAKQVALLQSDPGLGLVNCGVATIDEQGRVTGREFVLIDGAHQQTFSAYFSSTITSAFAMRREVARTFLQRPEFNTAVDYDFFARLAEHWRLAGVPEILLHYRRHSTQITITARHEQVFNECVVRLISARRRAGRSEQLEALETEFAAWRLSPPPPAVSYATFMHRFLQERYATLAVYHARKLLTVKRTPSAVLRALRVLGAAMWFDPRRAVWLLRLFLTGPVRAHGLKRF